jgi:hypothetical protein
MSGKRITWLAGLLVVQLVVVAVLLFARGGFREPETGPLLAFDAAAIDGILIEEGKDKSLELRRGDAGWTVAGQIPANQVPADDDKVGDLLEKLAGLQAPWPVATTASARDRFEVTDENRQRLVRLLTGDRTAAELLLGTSPGFRRLHVRVPGQDAVYEVDLSHFELSTSADEWIDRAVLAAEGEVSAVAREGKWRIARSDDGWMLDDGAADTAKAQEMADRFANLRVLGMAEPAGEGSGGEPSSVFAITDARGEYRLALYGDAEGADYVIESDRQPGRFRLAAFIAEQIQVEPEALLPAPAGDSAEGAAAGAEAADQTAGVPQEATQVEEHDH